MLGSTRSPRGALTRTVISEGALVGLLGALVGGILGALISWYFVVYGLDMTLFADEGGFTYMGIAFSERIHFVLTPGAVLQPMIGISIVAALCAVIPAISAARIVPKEALSGRQ